MRQRLTKSRPLTKNGNWDMEIVATTAVKHSALECFCRRSLQKCGRRARQLGSQKQAAPVAHAKKQRQAAGGLRSTKKPTSLHCNHMRCALAFTSPHIELKELDVQATASAFFNYAFWRMKDLGTGTQTLKLRTVHAWKNTLRISSKCF